MGGNVGLVGRGAAAPRLPRDRRRAAVQHDGIILNRRGILRPGAIPCGKARAVVGRGAIATRGASARRLLRGARGIAAAGKGLDGVAERAAQRRAGTA